MDKIGIKCAICGVCCGSDLSFHRVKVENADSKWVHILGKNIIEASNTYVCSIHFDDDCFKYKTVSSISNFKGKVLKYLKQGKYPTKFLDIRRNECCINHGIVRYGTGKEEVIPSKRLKLDLENEQLTVSKEVKKVSSHLITERPQNVELPYESKQKVVGKFCDENKVNFFLQNYNNGQLAVPVADNFELTKNSEFLKNKIPQYFTSLNGHRNEFEGKRKLSLLLKKTDVQSAISFETLMEYNHQEIFSEFSFNNSYGLSCETHQQFLQRPSNGVVASIFNHFNNSNKNNKKAIKNIEDYHHINCSKNDFQKSKNEILTPVCAKPQLTFEEDFGSISIEKEVLRAPRNIITLKHTFEPSEIERLIKLVDLKSNLDIPNSLNDAVSPINGNKITNKNTSYSLRIHRGGGNFIDNSIKGIQRKISLHSSNTASEQNGNLNISLEEIKSKTFVEMKNKVPMVVLEKMQFKNIQHYKYKYNIPINNHKTGELIWYISFSKNHDFRNVWHPAIIINAKDAGNFETHENMWIFLIAESVAVSINLSDSRKFKIKPFTEDLEEILDKFLHSYPERISEKVCLSIFQLLEGEFNLGTPFKPYASCLKRKLREFKKKLHGFSFDAYPKHIKKSLINIKYKNEKLKQSNANNNRFHESQNKQNKNRSPKVNNELKNKLPFQPMIFSNTEKKIRVLSAFENCKTAYMVLNELGFNIEYYCSLEMKNVSSDYFSSVNYPIECLGNAFRIDPVTIKKKCPIDLYIGRYKYTSGDDICNPSGNFLKLFNKFCDIKHLIEGCNPSERKLYWVFENITPVPNNIENYVTKLLDTKPISTSSIIGSEYKSKNFYWTNFFTNNLQIPEQQRF